LETTLTIPHLSEGSHQAFDHNQPSTQAIPTIIEAAKQPTSVKNPHIQLQQANISTTMATTDKNGGGVLYSQSSLRVPSPQVISKEEK
jgi:hypothetical protein